MMTTCKDCTHYEACSFHENLWMNDSFTHLTPCDSCPAFKDRSRFVELPCKPGDIVFYMNRYRRNVWPMKIISVEINSQGINEYGCWCDVPESYTPICFTPIAIGKTVFFTQEKAEAELARRTANG